MGSKRSRERMERLRQRFYDGMAERGVTGDIADKIWDKLAAFANYGFPESHSVCFAYLVYASSWLKRHYPAAFCAALLNAQPMGFYSPHSLVQTPAATASTSAPPTSTPPTANATLEPDVSTEATQDGPRHARDARGVGHGRAGGAARASGRCGASATTSPSEIAAGRPYESMEDLQRRVPELDLAQLEAMATAGAFGCFDLDAARGAVGGRRGGAIQARPPVRHRHRGRRADAAGHVVAARRRSPTCGPPA